MGTDSEKENMLEWQLSLAQLLPRTRNQKQAKGLDSYVVTVCFVVKKKRESKPLGFNISSLSTLTVNYGSASSISLTTEPTRKQQKKEAMDTLLVAQREVGSLSLNSQRAFGPSWLALRHSGPGGCHTARDMGRQQM